MRCLKGKGKVILLLN